VGQRPQLRVQVTIGNNCTGTNDGAPNLPSPAPSATVSTSPPASPPATPSASPSGSPAPAGGCSLTSSIVGSWASGYRVHFTVTDSGGAPVTGWKTGFSFADSAESVANSWNAVIATSGPAVTASNEPYHGAISVNGATTWGMVVTGSNSVLSGLTCAPA
jgi:Cellulose binding domain